MRRSHTGSLHRAIGIVIKRWVDIATWCGHIWLEQTICRYTPTREVRQTTCSWMRPIDLKTIKDHLVVTSCQSLSIFLTDKGWRNLFRFTVQAHSKVSSVDIIVDQSTNSTMADSISNLFSKGKGTTLDKSQLPCQILTSKVLFTAKTNMDIFIFFALFKGCICLTHGVAEMTVQKLIVLFQTTNFHDFLCQNSVIDRGDWDRAFCCWRTAN